MNSPRDGQIPPDDVRGAAREYIRRGQFPVPMPHRTKKPVLPKWQTLRVTEATRSTFRQLASRRVNTTYRDSAPSNASSDPGRASNTAVSTAISTSGSVGSAMFAPLAHSKPAS